MAMFTGGKSTLDAAQVEEIKRLGRVAFTLRLDNQLVRASTDYTAVGAER